MERRGKRIILIAALSIIFCVAISCTLLFACSEDGDTNKHETLTEKSEITDIFCVPEMAVYDGAAHGIQIIGIKETDNVRYSTDGQTWKSEVITYADVGEYTVFCKVERNGFNDYIGNAKIIITPKEISTITAEDIVVIGGERIIPNLNGIEADDIIMFSVNSGEYREFIEQDIQSGTHNVKYTVTRKNHEIFIGQFKLTVIGGREIKIKINDEQYVVSYGEQAAPKIKVATKENKIIVTVYEQETLEIDKYNYCESIIGVENIKRDYSENSLTAEIVKDEIEIILSKRRDEDVQDIEQGFLYDGAPHGIETDGEILFEIDGEYIKDGLLYTEVGEYRTTGVVIKDGCLPRLIKCIVRIYPDMTGVYVSDNGVIEIDKTCAKLNNEEVEYMLGVEGGIIAGKEVQYKSGYIVFDGSDYFETKKNYFAININEELKIIERTVEYSEVRLSGNILEFVDCVSEVSYFTAEVKESVSGITINGVFREFDENGEYKRCYITENELWKFQVVWIVV